MTAPIDWLPGAPPLLSLISNGPERCLKGPWEFDYRYPALITTNVQLVTDPTLLNDQDVTPRSGPSPENQRYLRDRLKPWQELKFSDDRELPPTRFIPPDSSPVSGTDLGKAPLIPTEIATQITAPDRNTLTNVHSENSPPPPPVCSRQSLTHPSCLSSS